jgi:hypothetical protein
MKQGSTKDVRTILHINSHPCETELKKKQNQEENIFHKIC